MSLIWQGCLRQADMSEWSEAVRKEPPCYCLINLKGEERVFHYGALHLLQL